MRPSAPAPSILAVLAVLALAACGDDDLVGGATAVPTQGTDPSPTSTAAPPSSEETTTTEAVEIEPCDPSTTEIELGESVSGDAPGMGDSVFYCIEIPNGLEGVTATLSGLTADLDLWMAHPDLETLASGGFDFWFSDDNGVSDEVVRIPPRTSTGFVTPGRYYIEVSSGSDPSPFTLLVEAGT